VWSRALEGFAPRGSRRGVACESESVLFGLWLEKNNEGWGSITILRGKFQKCL